jgi:hypothetical protein
MSDGTALGPCACASALSVSKGSAQAPKESPHATKEIVRCPKDVFTRIKTLIPLQDGESEHDEDEKDAQKCTPGLFPDAGWVVAKRIGLTYHRVVLDAVSGKIVARAKPEFLGGSHMLTVERLSTVDFDADGKSEALEVLRDEGHGYDQKIVTVFRVKGATLEPMLAVPIALSNDMSAKSGADQFSYEAKYSVTKEPDGTRGLEIDGSSKGKRPQFIKDNLVLGQKRYVLHEGVFQAN